MTLGVWAAILLWVGAAQLTSGESITGTIRVAGGGPAAGVRVVAMAVPSTARRGAESVVFESLTQTDSTGRYRLDNISPGQYFVAAGPGYVLKSVAYGGKDFGLNPFQVDGKSLATLDLTLGYDVMATLKKVTARGKVINAAPELRVTTIRFASTIANGPAPLATLQPDGSFEFADIPVGAYRPGVIDPSGGANTSPNIFVIRDDVSALTIDLQNNPFPDFVGVRPERTVFTDGKRTEMTGVITYKLTRIGESDSAYFRMMVKDPSTGVVTPWAVFVEHEWQVPKIVVGETVTVPGIPSTDGTNRFNADPF